MKNIIHHRDTEGPDYSSSHGVNLRHGALTERVIACAIAVHKNMGPGLLEGIYESCLSLELKNAGIKHELQKHIPILYNGIKIDKSYCVDLIVEDLIILELKAVENLLPIHRAQLMTYMKLTNISLGLLINFNEALLKNGIRRVILNNDNGHSVSPWLNKGVAHE